MTDTPMGEMEHTPEPWRMADADEDADHSVRRGVYVKDGNKKQGGYYIAELLIGGELNPEANARRIVACVNACAGIPIEEVEATKYADEMSDFQMVMRHCAEIYDHASSGRISKPNTLPSEVIGVMDELERERIDEAVEESAREQDARIDALTRERDALREALEDLRGWCEVERMKEGAIPDVVFKVIGIANRALTPPAPEEGR